jgi:hypothetical protein
LASRIDLRFVVSALAALLAIAANAAESPRLIRSLSGPSGKVAGSRFVFDETRNRFVYPQDKSMVVYFEWETQPGLHVLTGIWKQPDGRVGSMSADVKIETQTPSLNCYWIFNLVQGMTNGVWTLEVRMDGQPAGSHPFEIAGMEEPRRESEPPIVSTPKQPSLDEIFKSVGPSLVWIHKLDPSGRRSDTTSGFVLQPNRITTAFQSIDAATKLEIEFVDGHKVVADEVIGWSRTGDWAVVKADTGSVPSITRGDPKNVTIGERLIVFNVEGNARPIGGIDIGGRRTVPGFGERIQISPPVAPEAAGGPLIDTNGTGRVMNLSPALWNSFSAENAATPLSEIPDNLPGSGKTLDALRSDGTLTAPITPMPEFVYAGTVTDLPKRASDPLPHDMSDFSTKDAQIWVYSLWVRKGKLSKGELSASIYDPQNRLRIKGVPKKVTLADLPIRIAFSFSPAVLQPGVYRVDVSWDGHPAWRTFIRITQ